MMAAAQEALLQMPPLLAFCRIRGEKFFGPYFTL
jgi:hypothetical protein